VFLVLVFYEMASPGQHESNILSSLLPIPVPYLYSLHPPPFLLLFMGQEGKRKEKKEKKKQNVECVKFLEASNVSTA
jgi:hypothetical protein